jgi:hypothetical protein
MSHYKAMLKSNGGKPMKTVAAFAVSRNRVGKDKAYFTATFNEGWLCV